MLEYTNYSAASVIGQLGLYTAIPRYFLSVFKLRHAFALFSPFMQL